jgi:hypothetical protein
MSPAVARDRGRDVEDQVGVVGVSEASAHVDQHRVHEAAIGHVHPGVLPSEIEGDTLDLSVPKPDHCP